MQKLRNAIFIIIALVIMAPLVFAAEGTDRDVKGPKVENREGRTKRYFPRDHPRRLRDIVARADSIRAADTVVVDSVAVDSVASAPSAVVPDSAVSVIEDPASEADSVAAEAAPIRPAATLSGAGMVIRGKGFGAVIDITANITVTDCPKYKVRYTLMRPTGTVLVNKQLSPNEWTTKTHQLIHTVTLKKETPARTQTREVSARAFGWLLKGVDMVSSLKCRIEVIDASNGRVLARRDTEVVPFRD